MTYHLHSVNRFGELLSFNDYRSVFKYKVNLLVKKNEALTAAQNISRIHHAKIAVKYIGIKRPQLDRTYPPIAIYDNGVLIGGTMKKRQ